MEVFSFNPPTNWRPGKIEREPTAELLNIGEVASLTYFPVKSMRGIDLVEAEIGPRGIVGDREIMVVDQEGKFLTQRELPAMALITPSVANQSLSLSFENQKVNIPLPDQGVPVSVEVWKDQGVQAIDLGDEAGQFLGDILNHQCRLVMMDPQAKRQVDLEFSQPGDEVGFADGFPFLLISEASLGDLNERIASNGHPELPMDRFRPNIVVSGVDKFAEDTWQKVRIGEVEFEVVKPCSRCKITTVNQQTAEIGKEPSKTLASYRRGKQLGFNDTNKIYFGQNLIHRFREDQTSAKVRLGDQLTILETK